MHQLVPLEFGALYKGLATLGADMHARAVDVQVLAQGRIVPKHLVAALQARQQSEQHCQQPVHCTVLTLWGQGTQRSPPSRGCFILVRLHAKGGR